MSKKEDLNQNNMSEIENEEIITEPQDGDEELEVLEPAIEEISEESRIAELEKKLEEEKKSYLLLMADFDNFRKRTRNEISEIIKNAGEKIFRDLLPIIDDFERGIKATSSDDENSQAVKDGMVLIYNKLIKFLEQNGVKEFNPEENEFDADKHEAISMIPAPSEDLKGKILDTVQKGYMINDKVLRYAKVVVAQK